MVHGNHVFIREDRQETLTCIHFQRKTSRDYDVMVGALPTKAGTYVELKALRFVNN